MTSMETTIPGISEQFVQHKGQFQYAYCWNGKIC